jgi:hypothetical protein
LPKLIFTAEKTWAIFGHLVASFQTVEIASKLIGTGFGKGGENRTR